MTEAATTPGSSDEEKSIIETIGDRIAEAEKYPSLRGRDAINRYLIDLHHWRPSDLKQLTPRDILLLLDGEFGVVRDQDVAALRQRRRVSADAIRQGRAIRR